MSSSRSGPCVRRDWRCVCREPVARHCSRQTARMMGASPRAHHRCRREHALALPSRGQPAHPPGDTERGPGGGAKARRERAARRNCKPRFGAAAAVALRTGPGGGAPALAAHASRLGSAALESAPSPSPTTQGLAPTIAVEQRAAPSVDASSVALDEFLGETGGGGLRYWHSTDLSLSDDDASVKRLIEQLPSLKEPKTCFRQILEWLGGDVRSAGPARRSAARRLLSRLVEHRPGCASLWAQLLAIIRATAA